MIPNHFKPRWIRLAFSILSLCLFLGLADNAKAQNTPVAGDDENFTYQDIPVTGNVYDNDYDLDGDELTFSVVSSTTNGVWDLEPNGDYIFTPNQYFTGIVELVYEACDEDNMCAEATLTMYVIFLNDAPQANDDAFNAELNTTRTFNARLNDVEPDNEIMLFYMVAPPSNGTASINVNTGVVTYTPANGYTGTDSFIYQACDPCNVCNQAVVSINVLPSNAPPVFTSVAITVVEDQIYSGSLSTFASDPDNDQLTYGLITNSPNGSVTVLANGNFTFNPQSNFNGLTSFFCQACDIVGQCTSAVASVTVTAVNDNPTAQNDAASGNEDTLLNGSVNGNDSDVEPGTLTYSLIQGPTSGTLNFMSNGSYQFTPPLNGSGSFTFQYQVCDSQSGCDQADVSLTISPVNDAPTSSNNTFSISEDNVLNATITGCTDIDSPTLNYAYISGANNGIMTIQPNGSFQYVPNSNWFGIETIIYQVCDDMNACSTGEIEITVNFVVDAPVVNNESVTGSEDIMLSGDVSLNDNNQGEGALTYSLASTPLYGVFTLNANGTFTYLPNENWSGVETIQYSGCNSSNACDGGFLTITINPVDDAPICSSLTLNLAEDTEVLFALSELFINVDGDNLNFDMVDVNHGELAPDNTQDILYTPENNFNGEDQVTFNFCDASNQCCSSQVTFMVSPVNDAPSAIDGSYEGDEDLNIENQLPVAMDVDNDQLTYSLLNPPMSGDVVIELDGSFVYTPDANVYGIDFFTYSVCDGSDDCDAAVASINIVSLNDTPVVQDEDNVCPLDITITGDVSLNDSDIESANLVYSIVESNGAGSIELSLNGEYTFIPAAVGYTYITYAACDQENTCTEGLLTIQTIDMNTAPVASNGSLSVNEDETLTEELSNFVLDNEGGELVYSLLNGDENAEISVSANGQLIVTPNLDFNGSLSLVFNVCDNGNLCSQANITVDVAPVNDAPTGTALELVGYQDQMLTGSLNQGISDDSDSNYTFELIETNLPGTLTIEDDGDFNYSPQQYAYGVYTFTYTICDEGDLCDTATSTIYIIYLNDIPVAEDSYISTNEEADYSGNLNEYVIELDQETLNFSITDAPQHGFVNLSENGEFVYSPDAEYSGFDQFTYMACDEMGTCDQATVTIEVVFMNDLPVANDDFFMVLEDDDVTGDVSLNDIELDIEIDSYSIYSQPDHGVLELNIDGTFTYTPNANYYGLDQAVIMMCDPCGACDFGFLDFEVTFINDMPVVIDEDIFVYQNTSYSGSVADNDYELDIEELTYFIVDDNSQGIFQLEDDGSFFFIPGDDALGSFYVEYMACDPCGACSYGTLNIEVGPLEGGNTAPTATNFNQDACAGQDLQIDLANYISDLQEADGDLIISYSQPSSGFVTIDGTTLNYFSNEDFIGVITLNYQVCDNGEPSLCNNATITINIYQSIAPFITDLYVENVTCANGSNGSIEILEIESQGNVTITWFNGSNENLLENLSAGYYEFTLTSDAQCSLTANYGIDVTAPPTGLTAIADVVGITNSDDGFIELIITGGQEPYTVNWSGISGTPDGTNLNDISSVGTYYASIEDANGCALDTSFSITGLQEITNTYSLACYPNPADQNLTVEISGLAGKHVLIDLVDITGNLIEQSTPLMLQANHKYNLSVAHLAAGYYTIIVRTDEIDLSRPFIKQ